MSKRKALELFGSTERAVLQLLWAAGPQTLHQVHAHFPDVGYTTTLATLQQLHREGLVTRTLGQRYHIYHAVPKAVVLHLAFERMLAELGSTSADRAHIVEALRHG